MTWFLYGKKTLTILNCPGREGVEGAKQKHPKGLGVFLRRGERLLKAPQSREERGRKASLRVAKVITKGEPKRWEWGMGGGRQ